MEGLFLLKGFSVLAFQISFCYDERVMATITIPKNLIKGDDLVIVTRRDYERLLRSAGVKPVYVELQEGLNEALAEVKRGEVVGPFNDAKQLVKSLRAKK